MKQCSVCNVCYEDTARFCTFDGNPLTESLPGPTVLAGRYRLMKLIGQGRLGEVYQAEDLTAKRFVSVKILPPDLFTTKEAETRFRAEVVRLESLTSPYIAATHAFGLLPNAATYLVTEFVEGRTLREELKETKVVPLVRGLEIARQAALGLGAAHQVDTLHLDLKPDNLLLKSADDGHGVHVKVVDFGLARLKDTLGGAVATESGSLIIRMPHYTSPEEGMGKPSDRRSDIYSLGIILYEMLCGRVPFEERLPMRVIVMHATQPPPPLRGHNPNIPQPVEDFVMRMLAKDPEFRPNTMEIVAEELSRLRPSDGSSAPLALSPTAPSQASAKPAPGPSLDLPLRLTIIDADDDGHKSRTISGVVQDASPQGMRIQTGTIATGQLNIIKDQTVAFKNRLEIEVDLPTGTVRMDAFAVRYTRAPDGLNWVVFIYIKEMPRADRRLYEAYLKTTG